MNDTEFFHPLTKKHNQEREDEERRMLLFYALENEGYSRSEVELIDGTPLFDKLLDTFFVAYDDEGKRTPHFNLHNHFHEIDRTIIVEMQIAFRELYYAAKEAKKHFVPGYNGARDAQTKLANLLTRYNYLA